MRQNNHRKLPPSVVAASAAVFLLMLSIPIALLVYLATLNAIALYTFHICCTVLATASAPSAMSACNRMVKCKDEETDKFSTSIMICHSLVTIGSYAAAVAGLGGVLPTVESRIAWAVISLYPCVCVPVAWLICRAYERYARAEMAKEGQVDGEIHKTSKRGHFVVGREDAREVPEAFDEVREVSRSQGIANDNGTASLSVLTR